MLCTMSRRRRRGPRHNTRKAHNQAPSTGLVNGAVVHNGCPAATTGTSDSTSPGNLNGINPPCMVYGAINHGKDRKAALQKTLGNKGSTVSAVCDASAPGRVGSVVTTGGISMNGATSFDTVDVPCNSDQVSREPSLLAAAKKQRKWKKFAQMKSPPPLPPQEEEDWECEIQEVTVPPPDWEKMCFGVRPYGPEDVLQFASRNLTLKQRDTVDLPLTYNYRPAIHHPQPVQWFYYSVPVEPDQFADADEKAHFARRA